MRFRVKRILRGGKELLGGSREKAKGKARGVDLLLAPWCLFGCFARTQGTVPCVPHFHDWFWTHQHKLGQKKAIIAVSRKLLMLIYLLLETGQLYQPPNQAA